MSNSEGLLSDIIKNTEQQKQGTVSSNTTASQVWAVQPDLNGGNKTLRFHYDENAQKLSIRAFNTNTEKTITQSVQATDMDEAKHIAGAFKTAITTTADWHEVLDVYQIKDVLKASKAVAIEKIAHEPSANEAAKLILEALDTTRQGPQGNISKQVEVGIIANIQAGRTSSERLSRICRSDHGKNCKF